MISCLLAVGVSFCTLVGAARADDLAASFQQPPASARPQTWWHWMNGNVSREGITADLEAMKAVGLGGFQVFDVTDRIPPGPVNYLSSEWRSLMQHALREADRLGLEVCLHNCAGWSSSGGPWITPESSQQEVVWSELQVTGPKDFNGSLPKPQARQGYYRDIVVLAFPTPKSEREGRAGFRIQDWKAKAGFDRNNQIVADTRAVAEGDVIAKHAITNLSGLMDAQGRLNWTAPPGEWTIIRLGHTTTGAMNGPAPDEGRGLESDKMSAAASELHWKNSVQKVLDDAGPLAGRVLNNVLIDSYEAGQQNWTRDYPTQFQKRMGYDLTPFLPALTGRVVERLEVSERFLWDFRRVIADLVAENYFGHFARMCEQRGLRLSIEPYGAGNFNDFEVGDWADVPMGEWWAMRGVAWYHGSAKLAASAAHTTGRRFVGAESFTARRPAAAFQCHPALLKSQGDYFFCQGVNRFIFHTFVHQPWMDLKPGMTMGPHGFQNNRHNTWYHMGRGWVDYLSRCQSLLQQGTFQADLCYYVSEDAPLTFTHRWDMQPVPPDGYDFDTCSRRTLMQFTVRDGKLVLPSGMEYRMLILPDKPMRVETLKQVRELVRAGARVMGAKPGQSPGLQGYPRCDDEICAIADELWGPCDGQRVTEHAFGQGKIHWSKTLQPVLAAMDIPLDVELKALGPAAETLYPGTGFEWIHRKLDRTEIYFLSNQQDVPRHVEAVFRVGDRQAYLWNPNSGKIEPAPFAWCAPDGRRAVRLFLDRAESVFVVFREEPPTRTVVDLLCNGQTRASRTNRAGASTGLVAVVRLNGDSATLTAWEAGRYELLGTNGSLGEVEVAALPTPVDLSRDWVVRFPAGWGTPAEITLERLICFTEHAHPEVRHFSGTAVYEKRFDAPSELMKPGRALCLDLGDVQVMAEVILNGENLGIVWRPPFRVDLTGKLRAQANHLEVRVVNLWVNRLIGDAQYPDTCEWTDTGPKHGPGIKAIPDWLLKGQPRPPTQQKTFVTWKFYEKDSPLVKSGLIGPVKLHCGVNQNL